MQLMYEYLHAKFKKIIYDVISCSRTLKFGESTLMPLNSKYSKVG